MSYLLFVDDVVRFVKASVKFAQYLATALEVFSEVYRLSYNLSKSNVFISGSMWVWRAPFCSSGIFDGIVTNLFVLDRLKN